MVIREKGFDRAAKKLGLTQPAVSRQIKQLEEAVGQILLIRTSPPKATKAGMRLLRHFNQVHQLEEEMLGELGPSRKTKWNPLSIGINADSLSCWFLDGMEAFIRKNRIILDLHVDDQEETFQLFKKEKVSAYIGLKNRFGQNCASSYLGSMNYKMVCTPEFKQRFFPKGLTKRRLKNAPIALFNVKDQLHEATLNKIVGKIDSRLNTFYIPSTEKLSDVVSGGLAFGYLPVQHCGERLNKGTLLDIAPKHPVYVDLYWNTWNVQGELLQSFSEEVKHVAKNKLCQRIG